MVEGFKLREDEIEEFKTMPLRDDFIKGQEVLDKFGEFMGDFDRAFQSDLYENVVLEWQRIWDTRTINALPKTFSDALIAMKYDIGTTYQPNATRSLDWLQRFGKCIDHIVPGISKLPGAGHGAFAKRNLQGHKNYWCQLLLLELRLFIRGAI